MIDDQPQSNWAPDAFRPNKAEVEDEVIEEEKEVVWSGSWKNHSARVIVGKRSTSTWTALECRLPSLSP